MLDFDGTIQRAAMLKAQAKELEIEANELLDSLGDLPIDNYVAGRYILKVQPNRRFDPVVAKKNLTPEQYEAILVPTPNSTVAKRLLSGDDYAKAQREYAPKRTIVSVEDED